MRIHGLTVCVDYCDFLSYTWPNNNKFLTSHTVVTSTTDRETQRYCHERNIRYHITDIHKAEGSTFNKAKMLNRGLEHIRREFPGEWILSIDADTYAVPYKKLEYLDESFMYGSKRTLIPTLEDYLTCKGEVEDFMGEWPKCMIGYFQLFNKSDIFYDESCQSAETSDHRFMFSNYRCEDTYSFKEHELMCFHLGEICKNWHGRVTPIWRRSLYENRV